ncbi:hypothetical protein C6P40_001012 [Pichia californica]|uniref:DUF3835 domain-containing protein n=1 Tax=Pichia californica TaxID=460514 RepID=A0A9P6WMF6_9ASCO|nr:hypothetical protein C6P40_001012 [[Candida] californica]
MEKELSIIDGILLNLAGILRFYEFEHTQYNTLLGILKQFQLETINDDELKLSHEIFQKESNKEIGLLEEKVKNLDEKIEKIRTEISSRNDSKEKLINLFNALKSVDNLDSSFQSDKTSSNSVVQKNDFNSVLPIMEIREELDENGDIINSEIKPYQSPESQLKKLLEGRKSSEHSKQVQPKMNVNQDVKPPKITEVKAPVEQQNLITEEKSDDILEESENPNSKNFLPFVIREEIDEDGNIIKSSMSRIPQMKPDEDGTSETDITNDSTISPTTNTEEVEEDQLNELFEDMGFKIPKVTEVKDEEPISDIKEVKIEDEVTQIPLKDDSSKPTEGSSENMDTYPVDTNDIYALELISDELNNQNNNENIQKRTFTNMFGGRGQNLFAQQIMNLRNKTTATTEHQNQHTCVNGHDDHPIIEEVGDIIETSQVVDHIEEITTISEIKDKKVKKSVSFNSKVDVKKVDDIWDDLRLSNAENDLNDLSKIKESSSTSFFKRSRETVKKEGFKPIDESVQKEEIQSSVISDVMERQIVESDPQSSYNLGKNDVFKTFDQTSLRKQLDQNMSQLEESDNLVKLSGKKPLSKFKMARAAEIGKKFQETHIPTEVREQLQNLASSISYPVLKPVTEDKTKIISLKSNMKSLLPNKSFNKDQKSKTIETPKDINPLPVNPQTLTDEDYEIIRNEASEGFFDDDEDMEQSEFISSFNVINEHVNKDLSDIVEKSNDKSVSNNIEYFPKYEKKSNGEEKEVIGTTLDYKSLSEDMDTMAKAYVLGLYDDDIHTSGEVIEEIEDFKKHNQIVEDSESSKLHERVTEINKNVEDPDGKIEEILEDNNPMVVSDIIENDIDDIMEANDIPDEQLDIELNDESLASQVALDYTRMRSNMIHKYKGGFRETDKEKEFVRPEGSERISRFKLARLGM